MAILLCFVTGAIASIIFTYNYPEEPKWLVLALALLVLAQTIALHKPQGILLERLLLICCAARPKPDTEGGTHGGNGDEESQTDQPVHQIVSAQNRWVLQLRFKRLIFSNEMNSTVLLNGNMMKKISSGGDAMVGRNHGEAETTFVPHFLAVCMANDINKIKPLDAALANRLRIVPYDKKFVDEPQTEFELKKDPLLVKEIATLKFQRVFIGLLIRRYLRFMEDGGVDVVPAGMLCAKNEWVGTEDDVSLMGRFETDFEITNDVNDYVTSEKVKAWIDAGKLGISMECLAKDIKKHCTIKRFTNVVNKLKKLNGKPVRVWFGIREIVEVDGDDLPESECKAPRSCDTTVEVSDLESEVEYVET